MDTKGNVSINQGLDAPTSTRRTYGNKIEPGKCQIGKKVLLSQKQRIEIKKIQSMESLIDHLLEVGLISEHASYVIQASGYDYGGVLFKELLKETTEEYSSDFRNFTSTLIFYSEEAYEYVRENFNKNLPPPGPLIKWHQTTGASPGFSSEAKEALKRKSAELEAKGQKLFCNLVFGQMMLNGIMEENVDLGTNIDGDCIGEARYAFVFMLVALNEHWKIPVAYFLINCLNGNERANLLLKLLEFIEETGVVVTSITFNEELQNWNMAESLGVDMSVTSSKTYLLHPSTGSRIYVFFNPKDLMKMVELCFESTVPVNGKGQKICWKYIDKLCNIQKTHGFHVAKKFKRRHLSWKKEGKRVKLAVHTLSNTVADALNFLEHDLKLKDFEGSEGTAEFCKVFNDLFDIFNSKNLLTKRPFEKPLSPAVSTEYFNYLDKAVEYISKLKHEKKLLPMIAKSISGFIISIKSLKSLYQDHISMEQNLKYLPSYKLSLNPLEIFFRCIQNKTESKYEPTTIEFTESIKSLIIRSETKGSSSIALDSTSVLHCSSGSLIKSYPNEGFKKTKAYIAKEYKASKMWNLTTYLDGIVMYTSRFVVKGLEQNLKCLKCCTILEDDICFSRLERKKAYGRMFNESLFVIGICKKGEKTFRLMKTKLNLYPNKLYSVGILTSRTMMDLPKDLFLKFGDHLFDEEPLSNHGYELVKSILEIYFNVRIYHEINLKKSLRE